MNDITVLCRFMDGDELRNGDRGKYEYNSRIMTNSNNLTEYFNKRELVRNENDSL